MPAPFAVAHRAPATADACAALAASGASVFELDVQLSSRGVVVSHFQQLPRPLSWFERDNWRMRRSLGLAQDELLHDVLQVIPPSVDILLDLKEPMTRQPHELRSRLAAEVDLTARRWIVSTEVADDLAALRRAGFVAWRTARSRPTLERMLTDPFGADGASVRHTLLDARALAQLTERTDTVVAWTVNSRRRARYLLELGVAGITTDSGAVVDLVASAASASSDVN